MVWALSVLAARAERGTSAGRACCLGISNGAPAKLVVATVYIRMYCSADNMQCIMLRAALVAHVQYQHYGFQLLGDMQTLVQPLHDGRLLARDLQGRNANAAAKSPGVRSFFMHRVW